MIRWLRRVWRTLKNEQATPTRLGVAVALGVVLGCSPLLGLQTILCVVLAQLFKLNKLAALAGVQISVPPLTPVVAIAAIQVGHFLLYGDFLELSLAAVKAMSGSELTARFFGSYAVGGLVLGGLAGAFFGGLTTWAVRRVRAAESGAPGLTDAELDALDDLLQPLPARFRHYGGFKVRMDPVYPLALPVLIGRAQVVDLGAGIGLLAALLQFRSPATKIRCVEWDATKAACAIRLLGTTGAAEVVQADARTVELGAPDAICLFDVLHYCPIEEQRAWLTRCAQALAPGGVLVIRELDPERGHWGLAEKIERRAVKRGWNQGGGVHPWPISSLRQALEAAGLEVAVQPAGKGLFSANALVIATRPGGAAQESLPKPGSPALR